MTTKTRYKDILNVCLECDHILDSYKELAKRNSSGSDNIETRIDNMIWKKMRICLRDSDITTTQNDTIAYIKIIQEQIEVLHKVTVRLNETCPELIKIYELNRIYERALAILHMLKCNKIK